MRGSINSCLNEAAHWNEELSSFVVLLTGSTKLCNLDPFFEPFEFTVIS